MGLKDDITSKVNDILTVTWSIRDGQVVPDTDDVNLSDGAVKIEAAYLYADLADSTSLARDFDKRTAARVVRSYLHTMTKLITSHGGAIRSFDGDRVMGIFIGDSKRTTAAKCALQMNYVFKEILRPAVESKLPNLKTGGYTMEHTAGVDVGEVLIVRGGVRGSNDLVSIGAAPNIAAKLSDIREAPYRSYITKAVYDDLHESAKLGGDENKNMWEAQSITVKGQALTVYRSSWHWSVS
jgi:class 3 adenylate cyclase